MSRDDFMARFHALAEQIGGLLYAALEVPSQPPAVAVPPAPAQIVVRGHSRTPRASKPQRCSRCERDGHNARTCKRQPIVAEDDEEEVSVASPPPPRRPARFARNVPPPGWTIEGDRREEFQALSELTLLRKCS